MKLIQTISELRAELDAFRKEGKTIGLVPTMGALHAGHASLVNRAVAENDVVVVSDFVNPTQFNDQNDLLKYPRTREADCALLEKCGATLVFAPSVEEVYPEPDTRQFSYAPLDTVMEGKYRPGHFNGVCQITHIGIGIPWDLDRNIGGVTILPPYEKPSCRLARLPPCPCWQQP